MKSSDLPGWIRMRPSHPSRGAWIEIGEAYQAHHDQAVAPLTGCVD